MDVYIDKLGIFSILKVTTFLRGGNIRVLNDITCAGYIWVLILRFFGISVIRESFFLGNLKTTDGECAYTAAQRISSQCAVLIAETVIRTNGEIGFLNRKYGRNALALFIAKRLRPHIEYYVRRILIFNALNVGGQGVLLLPRSNRFDQTLLNAMFDGVNISYYSNYFSLYFDCIFVYSANLFRNFRLTGGFRRRRKSQRLTKACAKPGILVLQENPLRMDRRFRGELNWCDFESQACLANVIIVKVSEIFWGDAEDESKFVKLGLRVFERTVIQDGLHLFRNNSTLASLLNDEISCYKRAVYRFGTIESYLLFETAFLLSQARLMAALVLLFNAKLFLGSENYHSYYDAIQLTADSIGLTTISYQYSNLPFPVVGMLSSADIFFTFSGQYSRIYNYGLAEPRKIVPVGYPYGDIQKMVKHKSDECRAVLKNNGASFVVCYFDESVQYDKWGLVSLDEHLAVIHGLVRMVLKNETIGLVIKSQFSRNTPSKLHPNDEYIKQALDTGRYIELVHGEHRNDIYPAEAALAADICLGHKFGATAALEAALAGVRAILLDLHGVKTLWDDVYSSADVEYSSIESAIDGIERFMDGDLLYQNLGDWSEIIGRFDEHRDAGGPSRLREVIMKEFGK